MVTAFFLALWPNCISSIVVTHFCFTFCRNARGIHLVSTLQQTTIALEMQKNDKKNRKEVLQYTIIQ
jgi:accessory gene regulator protein AgrB